MMLAQLSDEYVTFKQSIGMRFRTESRILKAFCRAMGDIDITKVDPLSVERYLAGTGPITTFWHRKFEALSGFYRHAIARGLPGLKHHLFFLVVAILVVDLDDSLLGVIEDGIDHLVHMICSPFWQGRLPPCSAYAGRAE